MKTIAINADLAEFLKGYLEGLRETEVELAEEARQAKRYRAAKESRESAVHLLAMLKALEAADENYNVGAPLPPGFLQQAATA